MKCCKSWKLDGPNVPQCVAAQRRLSRGLSGRHGCYSSFHENMKFCSFQKQRWRGKESETTWALVKKPSQWQLWFASLSYEIKKQNIHETLKSQKSLTFMNFRSLELSWTFMNFYELSWTFVVLNFHELSRTFKKLCSLKVITLQCSTREFSKIMKSQSLVWVSTMRGGEGEFGHGLSLF